MIWMSDCHSELLQLGFTAFCFWEDMSSSSRTTLLDFGRREAFFRWRAEFQRISTDRKRQDR